MSSQISEVEAGLALKKHDRRVRLLRELERGSIYYKWVQCISIIAIAAVALLWERSTDSRGEGVLLVLVAGPLVLISGSCFAILSRRIDILIELLQQEGMLHSQFPASHVPDSAKAPRQP